MLQVNRVEKKTKKNIDINIKLPQLITYVKTPNFFRQSDEKVC